MTMAKYLQRKCFLYHSKYHETDYKPGTDKEMHSNLWIKS